MERQELTVEYGGELVIKTRSVGGGGGGGKGRGCSEDGRRGRRMKGS